MKKHGGSVEQYDQESIKKVIKDFTATRNGIDVFAGNQDIKIHENVIQYPQVRQCVKNQSPQQQIDIQNNICMPIE